jgi:hypothetical protein
MVKASAVPQSDSRIKVRPAYRENYNNKRREKALEKLKNPMAPTAEEIAARIAFNLKAKNKYKIVAHLKSERVK